MGDGSTSSRARRGTLAGQQIAGHELIRVLASGGMGDVYLAQHRALGMHRAIKVIRESVRDADDAHERFTREAQVLARLSHNSIVQIIDFGELPNGWPFLAMEYIEGPNLDDMVAASGPMPWRQALVVLEQIAAALTYAHTQRVIHRDLKPANVLLRGGDPRQVKVIDFGLAYSQRADGKLRLTVEGQMVGSPLYMAPEQGEGRLDVTTAVDVYALAGVAYTLISGSPPFHGLSLLHLISAHADTPPPRLTERCPELPRFLDELLLACLAKDPAARPHTDELVGHLSRLARETQTTLPAPSAGSPPAAPAMFTDGPTEAAEAAEAGLSQPKGPTAAPLTPRPVANVAAAPGQTSAIARLLDRPPPDDGSGVAPALVNQVLGIVGDLAATLSSHDGSLARLVIETEQARAELTDVEMELALLEADLEADPGGAAASQPARAAARARAQRLTDQVTSLVRAMIDRVEVQRGRADGLAIELFAEVDQVLAQIDALPRSRA